MNNKDQSYDGALISELGVKRYLKATSDIKISNVNFLIRGASAQKAWQECNFGCHGPTYRNLQRPSTKSEFLKPLDNISPLLAGIIDGVHHQTIGQAGRITGGTKRTVEGLHLSSTENFQNVGDENIAIFEFSKTAFEKVINFEIDIIDNPLSQIVMATVSEYVSVLPEWVIEEILRSGALILPDTIDTAWLLKATTLGVIENINQENIAEVLKIINKPAQRLIGKQIGKKLAPTLAVVIASAITKKIMSKSVEIPVLKRRLVRIRQTAKQMKGGLGGAMLTLLNTQGILNIAAESSRNLQRTCPRLWNILRFRLNGANMVYFLVEGMTQEYVDRLALLEQNPKDFGKVIEALIKAKQTQKIFFP
jgi:hypothetical protein